MKELLASLLVIFSFNITAGEGGVDGGGGDINTTPISLVTRIINKTWNNYKTPNSNNYFYRVIGSMEGDVFSGIIPNWELVESYVNFATENPQSSMNYFRNHWNVSQNIPHRLPTEGYSTKNFAISIQDTPLIIKEDAPCLDFNGNEVDASVTSFDLSSSICISSYRLSRFPSYSIKGTAITLLGHEIAHLFGANEDVAEKVEKAIETYIPKMFSSYYTVVKGHLSWKRMYDIFKEEWIENITVSKYHDFVDGRSFSDFPFITFLINYNYRNYFLSEYFNMNRREQFSTSIVNLRNYLREFQSYVSILQEGHTSESIKAHLQRKCLGLVNHLQNASHEHFEFVNGEHLSIFKTNPDHFNNDFCNLQ